jgi:hypothetical protein
MNSATLMRPLANLGFGGYWISVCGQVWAEASDTWIRPVRPKRTVRLPGPGGQAGAAIRRLPGQIRATRKTIRLPVTGKYGRKYRQMGVADLVRRAAFGNFDVKGYVLEFANGECRDCALWNISYVPGESMSGSRHRSGYDGLRLYRRLLAVRGSGVRHGFQWMATFEPPPQGEDALGL